MSCCDRDCSAPQTDHRYRRILWVALTVNLAMFGIEIAASIVAGSVSLRADALDFLGDAANYAVALAVVGLSLQWRAGAALLKGSVIVRGRLVQVAILIPNRRRVICSIQLSISCASSGRD